MSFPIVIIDVENMDFEHKDSDYDLLKSLKKDGDISEDEAFRSQDEVQKITDEHIKLIDECYSEKEKEILEF